MHTLENDKKELNKAIHEFGSISYFLKSTPFSILGNYNYDGMLTKDIFFNFIFSPEGESDKMIDILAKDIFYKRKKTLLLFGYQGSGKTTFIYYLIHKINEYLKGQHPDHPPEKYIEFHLIDFDIDTYHPKIKQYIEKVSHFLILEFMTQANNRNAKLFYELFLSHQSLHIFRELRIFFSKFNSLFLESHNIDEQYDFEEFITELNFNNILIILILWSIAIFLQEKHVKKHVFVMDNIDVLKNSADIEDFFENYALFTRNIDDIIRQLNLNINSTKITYSSLFTFIICTRESTWAKVVNDHAFELLKDETDSQDISNLFIKPRILKHRLNYLIENRSDFDDQFISSINDIERLLNDFDIEGRFSVFNMFNNDYRRCVSTFSEVLENNKALATEYYSLIDHPKSMIESKKYRIYGARGMVYRSIWNRFRYENLFKNIGVLDVNNRKNIPFSDARLVLTYLSEYTTGKLVGNNFMHAVDLDRMYRDLGKIGISPFRINSALNNMFNIKKNSAWSHLVNLHQIHTGDMEELENNRINYETKKDSASCFPYIKVSISIAGEEYLRIMDTHFEFFSCRACNSLNFDMPLFYSKNLNKLLHKGKYKYRFQVIIDSVIKIVHDCCNGLNDFMTDKIEKIMTTEDYMCSCYNYHKNQNQEVLHGERIIHTHIRYLDHYRLYLLNCLLCDDADKDELYEINKILVEYIEQYIIIGKSHPKIISSTSQRLFPKFIEKIELIKQSNYTDMQTEIDIERQG